MNAHAAGEAAPSRRTSRLQCDAKQTRARTHALLTTAASVRWRRRIGQVLDPNQTREYWVELEKARFCSILSARGGRHSIFLRPYFRKPARRGESAMRATARGDAAGATNLRLAGAARLWLGGRQGTDAAAADSARQAVLAPH
jgi:hypothetical protein